VDEYLAMGKPVIATRTKTMELFKDHVYLCDTLDEYNEAIEKALNENSLKLEKERIAFARSHSWQNSVRSIYQYMQQALN
jgi:glycosyltransferase involved in cell wall biosynthesis